jgi:hypothetical protein
MKGATRPWAPLVLATLVEAGLVEEVLLAVVEEVVLAVAEPVLEVSVLVVDAAVLVTVDIKVDALVVALVVAADEAVVETAAPSYCHCELKLVLSSPVAPASMISKAYVPVVRVPSGVKVTDSPVAPLISV